MPEDNLQNTDSGNLRNRLRAPDPQRFRVSRGTLRIDAFMTKFIFVGGLSVIMAIFGIFFFILAEILPLFQGAEVEEMESVKTGVTHPVLIGSDEWTELPFLLSTGGEITFIDLNSGDLSRKEAVPMPTGAQIVSTSYTQEEQAVSLGLDNGYFISGKIQYSPQFQSDGTRTILARAKWDEPATFITQKGSITDISLFTSSERKTVAGIISRNGQSKVQVNSYIQKRSLFGASGFKLDDQWDLTDQLSAIPLQILIGANATALVVRTSEESVHYFNLEDGDWKLRQTFEPFPNDSAALTSMAFIKGNVSLSFTNSAGSHVIYSLYRSGEEGRRIFGLTKTFQDFTGGAEYFARSSRNKAFLIGNSKSLSLRYSTTADVRWESTLATPLDKVLISGKFDQILGVDTSGTLHRYRLDDPHPEAGFRAFFSKIWYEGQDSPQFLWQSTGGSDEFEPKLSLIPLIIGSFKGTVYALLFAVPIALLAAIYTSQFLNPGLKRVIKPGIEIMASLPSVVLGFLAALWLAPIIEDRIPSVLTVCLAIPASAMLIGYFWNLLPIRIRILIPKGWEFITFLPTIVLVSVLAWKAGPLVESLFFNVSDQATGEQIADFRLWWEAWTGSQFQQRNSLVVGFMMGFAVIPIIYTIAEDALSAVPPSLTSGSLALGASRWQTTARLVLPTASAGIFSACMIGLGRAVGETMIVVMATGNTPIMDMDIFSGMRTLSANIAVELPEAPHGGTLYRTLFLGAFVLFVLTFMVNTVAETLRHRLRDKYKVIN
jgi:phosphate transport system permease protein